MNHQLIEQRSLELHRFVAIRILEKPELFELVKDNILKWEKRVTPQEIYYLTIWKDATTAGIREALKLACEDSREASDLRQSSPFAAVLQPEERLKFLTEWRQSNAPSGT